MTQEVSMSMRCLDLRDASVSQHVQSSAQRSGLREPAGAQVGEHCAVPAGAASEAQTGQAQGAPPGWRLALGKARRDATAAAVEATTLRAERDRLAAAYDSLRLDPPTAGAAEPAPGCGAPAPDDISQLVRRSLALNLHELQAGSSFLLYTVLNSIDM